MRGRDSEIVESQALTAADRKTLEEAELKIEGGLKAFVEVGIALSQIKESRLYRETHRSFAAYLKDRWGIERAHGYRLIKSSRFIQKFEKIAEEKAIPLPSNERQIRLLNRIGDHEKCCNVLKRAGELAAGGPIDYHHITESMRELHLSVNSANPTSLRNSSTPPLVSNNGEINELIESIVACLKCKTNCARELALLEQLKTLLSIVLVEPGRIENSNQSETIEIEGLNTNYAISYRQNRPKQ